MPRIESLAPVWRHICLIKIYFNSTLILAVAWEPKLAAGPGEGSIRLGKHQNP